jgi:hypothetical protein
MVGATVWYRFTPPSTRTVQVQTLSSNFDTILTVYSSAALDPVICNDDTSGGYDSYQSLVTFRAVGGTTYYIQAGGWTGSSGELDLAVRAVTPLANDAYANAAALALGETKSVFTRRATKQSGEPAPSCAESFGATVWYRFTLESPATVDVQVSASDVSEFAAVYSGATLGSLSEEGCLVSQTTAIALAAGTYYVQVGGSRADSGWITVTVELE